MSFDFIDNKTSQVPNNVPLQNQNINQRSVQKAVEVLPDITTNSTDGFKAKFTISNDNSSNLVPVVNEIPTENPTKTEKKRRKITDRCAHASSGRRFAGCLRTPAASRPSW